MESRIQMGVIKLRIWIITVWKPCNLSGPVWNWFLPSFKGREARAWDSYLACLGRKGKESFERSSDQHRHLILLNGCSQSGYIFESNVHCKYSMNYWRNCWHLWLLYEFLNQCPWLIERADYQAFLNSRLLSQFSNSNIFFLENQFDLIWSIFGFLLTSEKHLIWVGWRDMSALMSIKGIKGVSELLKKFFL